MHFDRLSRVASYEDLERGAFERYKKHEEDLIERGKDMLAREAECEQKLLAAEKLFAYMTKARLGVSLHASDVDSCDLSSQPNQVDWQVFCAQSKQYEQLLQYNQENCHASAQVLYTECGTQTTLQPLDTPTTPTGTLFSSQPAEFTPDDVEHW